MLPSAITVAEPTQPADAPLGAFHCDGRGGGRALDWNGIRAWEPGAGWLWLHLDRTDAASQEWLRQDSGLSTLVCEALLEQETRPRVRPIDDALLVILRGVNMNPGVEPDDMIALRLWVEAHRIITLRHRRLHVLQDVRDQLIAGQGPRSPGECLVAVATRLVDRQAPVVEELEDTVDEIESAIVDAKSYALRTRIADVRRRAIGLRRYIAPQRDVLVRIPNERVTWLDELQRARLRELGDRQLRLVEEVDEARERAAVAQEELGGRLAEQMNRNMYVLSLVAGVFLPLGLLTGLLGINVGGIPGSEEPHAFLIVCGVLLATAALVLGLFRRFHML